LLKNTHTYGKTINKNKEVIITEVRILGWRNRGAGRI
jgi:hypothetical protein